MTSSTVSRAPSIATKLEIARSARAALDTQIAEAALESAEDSHVHFVGRRYRHFNACCGCDDSSKRSNRPA
jgi:hypothetical protein